jgi:phenylpyruvate tautomerase PptA (4-oxalocrotonate tautomerase family)
LPLLKLSLSLKLEDDQKASLLQSLSKVLADGLGKPENYVMVSIEDEVAIIMSGEMGPAAFADIRSIGALNDEVNKEFSNTLCTFLNEQFGIPTNRIYINYTDMDASYWGWNSSTFG